MKTLCKLLLIASFATLTGHALGQGSSITYQGRLMSGTNGANGTYDFRFAAFDALAAGNQVGSTVNLAGVGVTNGLFTVVLDFSTQVFDGSNRWLEIAARTNGSGVAFMPMTPRQSLTPTPYAIKAGGAATADVAATVSGVVPASKIGGALTLAQLPAGVITNNVASMVVGGVGPAGTLTVPPASHPVLVSTYPGMNSPRAIVSDAGRFYVINGGDSSLQIFRVDATGMAVRLGSVTTEADPVAVAIDGHKAYVISSRSATLEIFDVTDPAQPARLGAMVVGDHSLQAQYFRSVAVSGRYAYVTSQSWFTLAPPPFGMIYEVDVSTPSSMAQTHGSLLTPGNDPGAVASYGTRRFLLNRDVNVLQTFEADGARLLKGQIATGKEPSAVAVGGGLACIACATDNTLQVYDISRTVAPARLGVAPTGSKPSALAISGGVVFLVNQDDSTLQVFDIGDPRAPRSLGTVPTLSNPTSIAIVDRYAVVAGSQGNQMQVFDVGESYVHRLRTGSMDVETLAIHGDLSVTDDAVFAGVLSVKRTAQFDSGLNASGLRLSDDRSFGLDNAVCYIENRSEWDASPALRVVGHAFFDAAALSVSQLHQGLIAQFGNSNRWVASIDSQGNMNAASYAGDGSGLSNIAASSISGTLPATLMPPNLALRDAAQTFSARNTFAQELTLLGGTAAQYPLDVHGTAHAGSPDAGTLQITDNAMDVGLRLRNTSAAGRTWSLFSSGTGSGLGAGSFSIWEREAQAVRLSIAPNGYVGIGTTSPGAALDVNTGAGNIQLRSDGVTPCINVANSPNPGILRLRDQLQIFPSDDGKRAGLLDVRDQSGNSTVRIAGDQGGLLEAQSILLRDDAGHLSVSFNGRTGDVVAKTALFVSDAGSTIFLNGANGTVMASAFNTTSDRNAKEEFRSVDPRAVLEKVTSLPLSEWQFKGAPETRHIGPMAQDFHAAFGVGPDDRHIATVDADGVALAAIQGLNQTLQEAVKAKDAEIGQLRRDVAELRTLVEKLAQSK